MTFHVGQKVVCVKQGSWKVETVSGDAPDHFNDLPQKGLIYTIAEIECLGDRVFLALVELASTEGIHWFISHGFRPLKSTDISVFKAMLVSPPKKRARA